jgi:hypothetical protein
MGEPLLDLHQAARFVERPFVYSPQLIGAASRCPSALRRTRRRTARSKTGLDDVGDGTSGEDVRLERFKAVKARTLALIADNLCRKA